MLKSKSLVLFLICIMTISLTGCWDKLEINDRSFVTAIGFDKNDKADESSGPSNKYDVSFGVANVKSVATGEGEPAILVRGTGSSMLDVMNHVMDTTSRYIYLDHTKAVIISEDLAERPECLKEILDGLERNPSVGRKLHVLIANNAKAKDILAIKPEVGEQIGFYINDMMNRTNKPGRFNPETLGEFLQQLHRFKSALIPRITISDGDIVIFGSGIIKNYVLVGYIDWIDTRSIMLMNNDVDLEDINILYKEIPIPFLISDSKATKKITKKDDEIMMSIDLEVEGSLQQYKLETNDTLFDNDKLEDIEKNIEATITKQIKETISKLQNDFGVDLIKLGDYLSKHEPDLWKEYENNWEDKFKDIVIDVKVEAHIRRIGMIK